MVLVAQVAFVLATMFGIVTKTYEARQQFALLERARSEQQDLMEEWGRLLLEESAFSSPARVERVAREELGMVAPGLDDVLELNQKGL